MSRVQIPSPAPFDVPVAPDGGVANVLGLSKDSNIKEDAPMALVSQSGPQTLKIGSPGPTFSLPATDGMTYGLDNFKLSKAVVISFTCNHCPYAQAYDDRFIALAREFMPKGISFVAVNANDAIKYPDDNFDAMKKRSR